MQKLASRVILLHLLQGHYFIWQLSQFLFRMFCVTTNSIMLDAFLICCVGFHPSSLDVLQVIYFTLLNCKVSWKCFVQCIAVNIWFYSLLVKKVLGIVVFGCHIKHIDCMWKFCKLWEPTESGWQTWDKIMLIYICYLYSELPVLTHFSWWSVISAVDSVMST
jgi:hypothetical protein